VSTCFGASSTYRIFGKNIKISIFGGISLGKIWQNLAILGNFGQIQLPWQWLIACPHLKGKKENVITYAKCVIILRMMAYWKAL
jgi:hypothetical protein